MPFYLFKSSRLIAYSTPQAVQPMGSTSNCASLSTVKLRMLKQEIVGVCRVASSIRQRRWRIRLLLRSFHRFAKITYPEKFNNIPLSDVIATCCRGYRDRSLKKEIIICSPKSLAQYSGSWQSESSPGNSKRHPCVDHEPCCPWESASGTLLIGW